MRAHREIGAGEAHRLRLPARADDVVEVDVRVHEAREQHVTGQRDQLRAGRPRGRVDRGDLLAIDDDDRGPDDAARDDIEVAVGLDDHRLRVGRDGGAHTRIDAAAIAASNFISAIMNPPRNFPTKPS